MKVINIVEDARIAGPHVRILNVARALKPNIVTTVAMPAYNSDEFRARCHESYLDVALLRTSKIRKNIFSISLFVFCLPVDIFRIFICVWGIKPDILHVSGGAWQFRPIIAAKLAGVPSIWHLNDTHMPGYIRLIFRMLSWLPSGYIFASSRTRDYYSDSIRSVKSVIIPSAVDLTKFDENKMCLTNEWISDRPTIGMVANINPYKGVEDFIRAVALVKNEFPDIRALVVGPVFDSQTGYHRHLLKLVSDLNLEDVVIWTGQQRDVRQVLRALDVYLCTSKFESSPISVWEAMAMEKAVISTDVGDVKSYIKNEISGYVVDVGDYSAIAKRAITLLKDTDLKKVLGKRARLVVEENFSVELIANQTKNFYKEIANSID